MQITVTVEIDEQEIRQVVENALKATYSIGDSWGNNKGAGTKEIQRQCNEWAQKQDYSLIISELAPKIMREIVQSTLAESIKSETRKQIKQMRERGELLSQQKGELDK